MNKNLFETIIGFFVIAVAIGFFTFAYKTSGTKKLGGTYKLTAKFDQVEGVMAGTDVLLSGIKVGAVRDLKLDPANYYAVLTLSIDENIKVPVDSSAKIVSTGLLGGKSVVLQAGADDEMLENGMQIKYTQSSVNFETLISKFMFSGENKENREKANG
jgi:phospholipid/cholesterol/gamma-HCH transport system substrate-binding protein